MFHEEGAYKIIVAEFPELKIPLASSDYDKVPTHIKELAMEAHWQRHLPTNVYVADCNGGYAVFKDIEKFSLRKYFLFGKKEQCMVYEKLSATCYTRLGALVDYWKGLAER